LPPVPAKRLSDAAGRSTVGERVGSLGWAHRTRGKLGPTDRIRLLGQGALGQFALIARGLAARLGLPARGKAVLPLEKLKPPETKAAREAEELCDEQRPDFLVGHCYRTFAWAVAIAEAEGRHYDPELLYVVSLVHDLGLSEQAQSDVMPPCFSLVGADAAEAIGRHSGWSEERAQRAAEAVTLHMNLRVRPEDGVEAYLMTAGNQLDLLGHRLWRLAPETVDAVLGRYPRDGVKAGMIELSDQGLEQRGSRTRFYHFLGHGLVMRAAPFEQ
jgi:hypothetical protein